MTTNKSFAFAVDQREQTLKLVRIRLFHHRFSPRRTTKKVVEEAVVMDDTLNQGDQPDYTQVSSCDKNSKKKDRFLLV